MKGFGTGKELPLKFLDGVAAIVVVGYDEI
jgi:hypothetical protein